MNVVEYKVTMAVPVYNVADFIERCAVSLFEQTYDNIEYLFIDDASLDDSINVLKKILNRYPQKKMCTRIIRHSYNMGLSAARNTAVENAFGEYIFHCDSDDYIELDAIEKLVKRQQETAADLVVANYVIETENKKKFVRYCDVTKTKEQLLLDSLNEKCSHSVWGILIRRSLYQKNQICAKVGVNVGEDWQVASQLLYYATNVAYVDSIVYHYMMSRPGSYTIESFESITKKKEHLLQFVDTQLYLLEMFKEKETVFGDAVCRKLVTFVQDAMIFCVKDNDKLTFYKMVHVLESVDSKYYDVLGKSNYLIMLMKKNYYLMKLLMMMK